jgi:hypothetical protein
VGRCLCLCVGVSVCVSVCVFRGMCRDCLLLLNPLSRKALQKQEDDDQVLRPHQILTRSDISLAHTHIQTLTNNMTRQMVFSLTNGKVYEKPTLSKIIQKTRLHANKHVRFGRCQ